MYVYICMYGDVMQGAFMCLQVEVPLSTAKKVILLTVGQYDTVFSAFQHVSHLYNNITE